MRKVAARCVPLLFLSLLSCRQYRYVYTGSKINAPLLKKQGDSRLNASYSSGGSKGVPDSSQNGAADLQAAYAVGKHFALTAAYCFRNEKDQYGWDLGRSRAVPFNTSFVRYRRRFAEAGAGFFTTPDRNVVVSLYGGIAFGRLTMHDTGIDDTLPYTRDFSARMHKFWLQPGCSFVPEKGVNLDASLRFSLVKYTGLQTSYSQDEQERLSLDGLVTAAPILFVEPSLTLSFPVPQLDWLRIETGCSTVFTRSYWKVRNGNFFVGLTTNPAAVLRRKK